eukprot:TRINITY_DN14896_c0_g1_i1.p1 TRINITY_DN14896_c0_g1~~TRINITY_DN14896_c0_g1_i1.p1  ORF type:complete len:736 (-),score=152.62 TRINITY_DN14896_c0_g1_i1:828-3005(-)
MGNITPAQRQEVEDYLKRQSELVDSLRSVVESQAKALALLEKDEEKDRVGQYEFNEAAKLIEVASHTDHAKWHEPEIDDAELKQPDADGSFEKSVAATKPWLTAMFAPSSWKKDPALEALPPAKLSLEHVYGYRGRLVKNNVFAVDGSRILYFVAGLAIVEDTRTSTQSFFTGHTDDILSMDYHKGSKLVCTGQQGRTLAPICVWEVDSLKELARLDGYHLCGVSSLAFSADGTKLASVGIDEYNSIAIYDWKKKAVLREVKGGANPINSICWTGPESFVTVGQADVQFWSIADKGLSLTRGALGKAGERQPFVSAVKTTADVVVVGTASGHLYPFQAGRLQQPVHAHKGAVTALAYDPDKKRLYSGGLDGYISAWNADFKRVAHADLNVPLVSANSVRAIAIFADELVVGTARGSILRVHPSSGALPVPLVHSHFGEWNDKEMYGELWGLAAHPQNETIATVGDDKTLLVWDAGSRKTVADVQLATPALCCTFSPDGALLAVGYNEGSVSIFETTSWHEELRRKHRRRRISCLKFSPDGNVLAVASADGFIDFHATKQEFQRLRFCQAPSVVLHFDWSADGKWIRAVTQTYELLFLDTQSAALVGEPATLRDCVWHTQECVLGWGVQGIWPKYSDCADVNAVSRSHNGKLLVTAEDSGLVKLFQFPCIGSGLNSAGHLQRRPKSRWNPGHSIRVANVAWQANDARVFTVGSADLAVFQWKVVPA